MWGAFERFALGCETDRAACYGEREHTNSSSHTRRSSPVSHLHTFSSVSLPDHLSHSPRRSTAIRCLRTKQSIPSLGASWQGRTLLPPYRHRPTVQTIPSLTTQPHSARIGPSSDLLLSPRPLSSSPSTTITLFGEKVVCVGVLAHISSHHPPRYAAATCQHSLHRLTRLQQDSSCVKKG